MQEVEDFIGTYGDGEVTEAGVMRALALLAGIHLTVHEMLDDDDGAAWAVVCGSVVTLARERGLVA